MDNTQPMEPSDETPTVDPAPVFVPASQIPRPARPPQADRPGYREPRPVLIPNLDQKAKLHMGRLQRAAGVRNEWFARIPAGVAPEALLNPAFWAMHAPSLRLLDVIEAFADDASWEAWYRVMAKGQGEVRLSMFLYHRHDGGTVEEIAPDDYMVKYVSPSVRFCVVSKDTGAVVEKGFDTKEMAYRWLADYAKRMKV